MGVDWPAVDVIVGNPPFLGRHRQRTELGDNYVDRLFATYEDSVPHNADLACYWFENARKQIECGRAKRVGLLATNSIRGGANRRVLERIKDTGDIFMAWSDREWILDGAAVRVSMVGFDDGSEDTRTLNQHPARQINADLTGSVDITMARTLQDNRDIAFIGPQKDGPLDIPNDLANKMLSTPNAAGFDNSEVIRPYRNGSDLVKSLRNYWIIDFHEMEIEQAEKYEAPFRYVEESVKPVRARNRERRRRENWWRLGRSGSDYRRASHNIVRQVFTPRVAKHRVFVWVDSVVFPDSAVVAIARDDDYFFGVLHSKLHEVWSLRMGTWLGKGNDPRYTPTTTFETFPFPWPPGQEDTSLPAHAAISAAAAQLHEERDAWLNPANPPQSPHRDGGKSTPDESSEGARTLPPPDSSGGSRGVKDRTLTNLYNALAVFRGRDSMKTKPAAADFAPRLDQLHRELDRAVCAAYGWDSAILDDEEEILRRLLALNLERAAQPD